MQFLAGRLRLPALIAFAMLLFAASGASAETRSLKLYFLHTGEKAEITFKKNGRYIPSGLDKINWFLRDWRRKEPTKMDPHLLDLIWEVYRESGSRAYIHVVSGYRSPNTNALLRSRSNGVAKKSQHMLGKAMDFYLPDVKLAKLRAIGLKLQVGGVGYYPTSGSPFVHMDTGNVRHWPRMSRGELMALFPDGKTLHVPSDGKPLPGYNQALAAYQSRKRSDGSVQIASASTSSRSGKTLFGALFGGGADDEEDTAEAASEPTRPAAPARAAAPARQPQPQAQPEQPQTLIAALPKVISALPGVKTPRPSEDVGGNEPAAPAQQVASAAPAPVPEQLPATVSLPEDVTAGSRNADELLLASAEVPVPTWRPDYRPEAKPEDTDVAVQVASVEAAPETEQSGPLRPPLSAEAVADMVKAAQANSGPTLAAYVPEAGGQSNDAFAAEMPVPYGARRDKSPSANDPQGTRLASVSVAASPRMALLGRVDGAAPAVALDTGVRTTPKGPRPGPADNSPDPKSMVVPVPPEIARWALSGRPMVKNTTATRAPSFAHDLVRTAPTLVYTAGFQSDGGAVDTNRFSGKAVSFLSVARFD